MALVTGCWCLDGMIFTIVAILGSYMYITRKFGYWKKRGVMEVSPMPVVGNFGDFILMKKSSGQILKDLYDQSSNLPYMGLYIFDRPFFLARDPELIKNILIRDFVYFEDRYASASPDDSIGRANLFTLKNPAWKLVRTKIAPVFTSGKLKKMFELMLEVGLDLDTHLKKLDLQGDGQILEVKELFAKYTTDLIGTTAYGLKVNSLNNPEAEFRKYGREIFEFNMWRTMEINALLFAPQFAKPMGFKLFSGNGTTFLRNVFWDTIVERERSGMKRNDLIDLLIELKRSQPGIPDQNIFEFDGDNLVAQAAIMFAGGFETTSAALSFTMYELALAPHVQAKLRAEIKDALQKSGGEITYNMVMVLPYLHMVVSETLRKYPILPYLDRLTTADYKVSGSDLVLEKGTPVFISLLGLHYDAEYFPNPEVFDPERFGEDNKRDRKSCVYMPFGDGPHMCIAIRLGLLQVKLGLIHILSNYECSPCDKTVIPMKLNPKSLNVASDGGLFLNIRKIFT